MPEREQTPERGASWLWKAKQAEAIYLMLLPEVAKVKAALEHH